MGVMGRVGVKGAALLFFVCMAALASVMYAPQARAAEFSVTRMDDPTPDGCAPADCSLREAVIATNAASSSDEINLPTGTYELSIVGTDENASASGDLDIGNAGNLTINGMGAENTIVDANGIDRVFQVGGPLVEMNGLTITGGLAAGSGGGGVRVNGGTSLTLEEVTVSDNAARNQNSPTSGTGGGIFKESGGNLTIDSSTVSGNAADSFGGGIRTETSPEFANPDINTTSKTTITNSTISGNTAGQVGGGVFNLIGLTEIKNSTITNNTAPAGQGSGIASRGNPQSPPARTDVSSSIIAANTNTDVDFFNGTNNTFQSNGYNLIGDGNATGAFNQTGDQTGVENPGLGPLADNGGPTETHAVQTGSPALDKGNTDLTEDQRGTIRPFDFSNTENATGGDGSDIGSFELNPGTLQFDSASYTEDEAAGTATITVERTGGTDGEATVDYTTSDGTATAGQDYTESSGTLTFAAGDNSETFTVSITDDATDEPDETVNLALSNAQGGATLGDPDEAVLTIEDNDEAAPPPDDGDGNPDPVDPDPVDPNACTITGTPGNDILRGTPGRDVICGTGGNDIIYGAGGDDVLRGDGGNDTIFGEDGADRIEGGAGNDKVRGGNGGDQIEGQNGKDALYGEAGNDTITGGAGNDVLRGGPGRDRLDGGPGGNSVKQ